MKKISTILIVSLIPFYFYSQNIELPDVTTVIKDEKIKVEADSIKTSDNAIVIEKGSGDIVPELPEEENEEFVEEKNPVKKQPPEKVFAFRGNGVVGGGYPASFKGNISIFNNDRKNPFALNFLHDSVNGYSGKALTDGFYDRTTRLNLRKTVQKEKFSFSVNGSYQSVTNGLQNHVSGISSISQDCYGLNGNFTYHIKDGFSAGVNASSKFNNRYADVTQGHFDEVNLLNIKPELFLRWHNKNFSAGFSCDYDFCNDFSGLFEKNINRVRFMLNGSWKNDFVMAYANAQAVVGNCINDNPIVVPFSVGANFRIPVSFAEKKLAIGVEGGIASVLQLPYELENRYRFTIIRNFAEEQTDWYGKMNVSIPVGKSFTGNISCEYRQTAFGNKTIMPDYSIPVTNGCYGYKYCENQQFNTNISVFYRYNSIILGGSWQSCWLDVPSLKNENTVGANIIYANKDSRFGGELSGKIALNKEIDVPEINAKVRAKLTDGMTASLEVNDAIKLIKTESRIYAGNYLGRGGNINLNLLFKF